MIVKIQASNSSRPPSVSQLAVDLHSAKLHPTGRLLYFFGANRGSPIPLPLSFIPSTLSIAPSTFWSGGAVPRSKSCMIETVVLHLVARSFCVILGVISFLRLIMACPTSSPTVLGLMISSLRSTFVRCCPSTEGFWGSRFSLYREFWLRRGAYCVSARELLLCGNNSTGSLGGVEGGFAFHHCLALASSAASASLATDASD